MTLMAVRMTLFVVIDPHALFLSSSQDEQDEDGTSTAQRMKLPTSDELAQAPRLHCDSATLPDSPP